MEVGHCNPIHSIRKTGKNLGKGISWQMEYFCKINIEGPESGSRPMSY